MTDVKGRAKEALGWLTADREVEAEGRAEQAAGEPSEELRSEHKDEVRVRYGETADGSDAPDSIH